MIVAISGVNDTDNPGPGVGIARSLKVGDPNIITIGLSYDVQDPGNYMDFVIDKSFILPFPTKGWDGILERITHIQNTIGLDFIIPALDAELPLYIKHQEDLKAQGINTFLPTKEQFNLRNKDCLSEVSKNIGIIYPETKRISSVSELKEAMAKSDYPVMIKGNYYKAHKVRNEKEAIYYFSEIASEWGLPVLVQKIVFGEELNVIGVGDGEGGNLGLVAIKKMTTTNLGKIWNGVTIGNPALTKVASDFVKLYKWRGPFELECIVNNDKIYMIEINPRFPAWVYFATGIGINLPMRLLSYAFGHDTEAHSDYKAGKLFIRYTYETISDIENLSNLTISGETK